LSCSRPYRVTPGKKPPAPIIDRRLGGSQGRSGNYGEEKISYLCRESNANSSAAYLVARRCTDGSILALKIDLSERKLTVKLLAEQKLGIKLSVSTSNRIVGLPILSTLIPCFSRSAMSVS
jgi:hypothetical protein